MINTLKMSFKIDFTYAINSFIYSLRKMPIIKNIIKEDLYKKDGFKLFVRILGIICTSLKLILFKMLYIVIIYLIAKFYKPKDINSTFIHLFFVFSVIGMFINTSILSTGKKKYLGVILFRMNAKEFILSHFLLNTFTNFILNNLFLLILFFLLKIPLYIAVVLSLFALLSKVVGEALNIRYYKERVNYEKRGY